MNREIDGPAFSGAVGVTLLPKHRRWFNRNTLQSGRCQPGKRRVRSRASVPAISHYSVTTGTLRCVFLVCVSHGHCHNYNLLCLLCLEYIRGITRQSVVVTSNTAKNCYFALDVTDLEWPRRFQESKVSRLHDNGTGWW